MLQVSTMHRPIAWIGIIAALLVNSVSSANETIPADSMSFAGVNIGFTAEQTIEALVKQYAINPEEITYSHATDPVAGLGKAVFGIKYESPELEIRANFYPDLRNSPVVDTSLTYLFVSKKGKNLFDEVVQEIEEQIGAPTLKPAASYHWCSELDAQQSNCLENTAQITANKGLSSAGVTVFLEDSTAATLFRAAVANK